MRSITQEAAHVEAQPLSGRLRQLANSAHDLVMSIVLVPATTLKAL